MTSTDSRTGTWVESLYGDPDHGPYADVIDASEAMDELGLSDEGYKITVYPEEDEDGTAWADRCTAEDPCPTRAEHGGMSCNH
jgi:hypothetical protein